MIKSFHKREELSDLLLELLESIVTDIREERKVNPKEGVYQVVKIYDSVLDLYQLISPAPKTKEIEEKYFKALEGK